MKTLKKILIFLISSCFLLVLTNNSYSFSDQYVSRQEWNADEELSRTCDKRYNIIKNVYITGITVQDKEIRGNTKNWTQGLYYFFSTKTLFEEIPFNYLVGWDGVIYEGIKNERDRLAPIENDNSILIGYLSNFEEVEITPLGEIALSEVLENIVSQYDLSEENIITKDWNIKPTDNLQKNYIQLSEPQKSSRLNSYIENIKSDLNYSESNLQESHQVEILNIEYPKEMQLGQSYEVTLKIKNTGQTNWYKETPAEITVATENNKDSEFYISDSWISKSQISIMSTSSIISQEEIELKFSVSSPLVEEEEYNEAFVLKTVSGVTVENSTFDINVTVIKGDYNIVLVLPTPTGYLNIREMPNTSGKLINQVLPGEKYLQIESNSGWAKILFDNEDEGWATEQYLKRL